jgi:hypothetical protein
LPLPAALPAECNFMDHATLPPVLGVSIPAPTAVKTAYALGVVFTVTSAPPFTLSADPEKP